MRTSRIELNIDAETLGQLQAALRAKGTSRSPSYAELAENFGLHPEQVRRVHKRMSAETNEPSENLPATATDEAGLGVLEEMSRRLANGEKLTGLFGRISREELVALAAGLVRSLYISGKQPSLTLKAIREYGMLENYYMTGALTSPSERKREITMQDLTAIEQETQEHLEAIARAKAARSKLGFLRKYGESAMEFEEAEIGSLGESVGG